MQIREKRETLIKRLVTAQTERFRRFEGCKQRPVSKRIGSSCHLQAPSAESSVKGRPVTRRKDPSDPKSDKPVAEVATLKQKVAETADKRSIKVLGFYENRMKAGFGLSKQTICVQH